MQTGGDGDAMAARLPLAHARHEQEDSARCHAADMAGVSWLHGEAAKEGRGTQGGEGGGSRGGRGGVDRGTEGRRWRRKGAGARV